MFVAVKLRAIIAFALVIIITLAAVSIPNIKTAETMNENSKYTLVIDPGHGGIDGGAIAASGLKESDVNLDIALKMRDLAAFLGINCVMTRETDTDNSEGGKYSEHDNLVKRAELTNSTPNAVLISVHQNNYPSALVKGAEVMYSLNEGSRELGEISQNNFIAYLDSSNRRVSHPAPENLLLTSSVTCPAILAECGFMSNPEEAQMLSTDEYRTKIALILMCSYVQFANLST